MGQYFMGVILGNNRKTVKSYMLAHDYGNGLKIMEHSWQNNKFVSTFESLILDNPQRVVWAGDYAENCGGRKTNIYQRCFGEGKKSNKIKPSVKGLTIAESRYVINHSKKVYVDKLKVPAVDGYTMHPLPLLTCEGNGSGGGDFYGSDARGLVGKWARNIVSVSATQPVGYKELLFDLIEN